MEKNIQENQGGYCKSCNGSAMNCHCYGMHHHSIVRILLALVILGVVFVCGMKLGELKAEVAMLYQNSAYQPMNHGMRTYGAAGMMNEGTTSAVSPAHPIAPATPAATTAAPAAK